MDINWNLYKRFYYVARYGSTQAASKELLVAQPSLSFSIKQLEAELGFELFKRSHKGMELTARGRVFYDYISQAYEAIENAESYAADLQGNVRNAVNVAVIDTTMHFFLMPHFERFKQVNPDIAVKVHCCSHVAEAEALIDARTVDFAVMHRPSGKERFISTPVKEISDVLVCSSAFASELGSTKISAAELKNHVLISHRRGTPSRQLVDDYLQQNSAGSEPAFEFDHISGILRQLRKEFSLAFILENSIEAELSSGELIKLELTPPLPKRYYYLIKPAGRLPEKVRRTIEFFSSAESVEEN